MKPLTVSLILLIIGTGFYVWGHSEKVCESRGGKWSSVRSECITRDCYLTNTCGEWTHPIVWCRNLKLGDDISEVYFQLGTPMSIQKNVYSWPVGKAESGEIVAIIENKRLISLNCDTSK